MYVPALETFPCVWGGYVYLMTPYLIHYAINNLFFEIENCVLYSLLLYVDKMIEV